MNSKAKFYRLAAIIAAWAIVGETARASYPYIEYQAWPWPGTGLVDPTMLGWVAHAGATGTAVFNDAGSGINAWRVSDLSTGMPNPNYAIDFSGTNEANAIRDGWRLSARARYVTAFGTGANLGLSVFLNNRSYHAMFNLNAAGDLQVKLDDETSRTYLLTTGGTGTAAFHNFELLAVAGTARVDFIFDGRVVNSDGAWDGMGLAHANTVHWGNSDAAGSNGGTMDFNNVLFEIGPFSPVIPGDYNGDGVTDGSDLALWQQTLGATGNLIADGNHNGIIDAGDLAVWKSGLAAAEPAGAAAPEPATLTAGIAAAALAFLAGRRRRGPACAIAGQCRRR